MTLKPFSEDVLEVLVETHREVWLPVKRDVTICQYLVERKLAEYEPANSRIRLTDEGESLYQKLVQKVKKEIHEPSK